MPCGAVENSLADTKFHNKGFTLEGYVYVLLLIALEHLRMEL
jgi:hypothetical protein